MDAECAWYGDPAFDAAFCLTHLLLKCLWNPPAAGAPFECFEVFAAAWLAGARWEPTAGLAARVGALLPALLLARVDGKSPVEYLVDERDRGFVRRVAAPLVLDPPATPVAIAHTWRAALAARRSAASHPPAVPTSFRRPRP